MILSILKFLFIVFEVVLLFNVLIIVHELGHFLAARWRGLVVEKFGIWFGKPLWKRKINGVEYSLGSIPAGGFVALPQMAPMEAIEGKNEGDRSQLPPISAMDKIIVAFAGPLFSFLLAIVFAVVVWAVGKPVSEADATTTIGYVVEGGPADRAGLRPGDRILEVDGNAVERFGGMNDSVTWHVVSSEGETIPFRIERDGSEMLVEVPAAAAETDSWWKRKNLRQVQILPMLTPMVARTVESTPAAESGLKPSDRIVEAGGRRLYHYQQLAGIRSEAGDASVPVVVERGGETLRMELPPPAPIVERVMPGSPAARAGVEPGDRIVSINGEPARSWGGVSRVVKGNLGDIVELEVERGGGTLRKELEPQIAVYPDGRQEALIGLGWKQDIVWDQWGRGGTVRVSPFKQVGDSVRTIVQTLGAVISPRSDVTLQHLSGPVGIMRIYYMLFESDQGWKLALWFSVVLNVNLAILNLLPLPVLDGGHITIALIEAIRRKPVNMKVLEVIQTGCAVLLIGFMLYVTFYDVGDLTPDAEVVRFVEPGDAAVDSEGGP